MCYKSKAIQMGINEPKKNGFRSLYSYRTISGILFYTSRKGSPEGLQKGKSKSDK